MLDAPRHSNADLSRRSIPTAPGVYAWFRNDACVYVGTARNLRTRLSSHRATSLDLSRSTLRASVAVYELGVTRSYARSRPSVMTAEQVAVVNRWFDAAAVAWVECPTAEMAADLERRLLRTRVPHLNLT